MIVRIAAFAFATFLFAFTGKAKEEVAFELLKDIPDSIRFEGLLSSQFGYTDGVFPVINGKPSGIPRSASLTEAELEQLTRHYRMIRPTGGPLDVRKVRDQLKEYDPEFVVTNYLQSTYLKDGKDAHLIAEHHRKGLLMGAAAKLIQPLNRTTTVFRIAPYPPYKAAKDLPILASTVPGLYSDADPQQAKRKFVSFIRIGDELMRVEKWDAGTGELTVTRGFDGSAAADHPKGAVVTVPLFSRGWQADWKKRDQFKDGKNYEPGVWGVYGKSPGYVIGRNKESLPLFQYKASLITKALERKFDGVVMDVMDMEPDMFELSDAFGNSVAKGTPWNFETNAPYDDADWMRGMELHLQTLYDEVIANTGKKPFIMPNGFRGDSYWKGGENFFKPTAIKPTPVDSFLSETGFMLTGPRWKSQATAAMDMMQKGYSATFGVPATHPEHHYIHRVKGGDVSQMAIYAYAFYLLVEDKDRKIESVAIEHAPLLAANAWGGDAAPELVVNFHPVFYLPIGRPTEQFPPAEIDKYLVPGTQVYRRDFTNGIVLLNPTGSYQAATADQVGAEDSKRGKRNRGKSYTVKLGKPYIDPDVVDPKTGKASNKGKLVREVTLAPGMGKILLKP